MPELPEVETIRRGLEVKLAGKRLARVVQRRPDLRFPLPEGLSRRLTGRRIDALRRRAKYLLIDLDDGMTVIIHLGMSGRMVVQALPAPAPGPHDHIIFETEDGWRVSFNDARRFGMLDLVSGNALADHAWLSKLGPEPLDDAFTGDVLGEALAHRVTPLKAALLDQRTVAGLGNIYVCEALFHAGLSPRRMACTVVGRRADRLAAAIKQVLTDAIAAGGSSLRDYVQADGELGYFQHAWAVYGREGLACPGCRCGLDDGGIRRLTQSGRSTFYCPTRQR